MNSSFYFCCHQQSLLCLFVAKDILTAYVINIYDFNDSVLAFSLNIYKQESGLRLLYAHIFMHAYTLIHDMLACDSNIFHITYVYTKVNGYLFNNLEIII